MIFVLCIMVLVSIGVGVGLIQIFPQWNWSTALFASMAALLLLVGGFFALCSLVLAGLYRVSGRLVEREELQLAWQ